MFLRAANEYHHESLACHVIENGGRLTSPGVDIVGARETGNKDILMSSCEGSSPYPSFPSRYGDVAMKTVAMATNQAMPSEMLATNQPGFQTFQQMSVECGNQRYVTDRTEVVIPGPGPLIPGPGAFSTVIEEFIPSSHAFIPSMEEFIPGTEAFIPGMDAEISMLLDLQSFITDDVDSSKEIGRSLAGSDLGFFRTNNLAESLEMEAKSFQVIQQTEATNADRKCVHHGNQNSQFGFVQEGVRRARPSPNVTSATPPTATPVRQMTTVRSSHATTRVRTEHDARRYRRREQNRMAARKCREKKKVHIDCILKVSNEVIIDLCTCGWVFVVCGGGGSYIDCNVMVSIER